MNKIRLFFVVLSLLLTQFSFAGSLQSQYPSVQDSLKLIEKVYLHIDRENYYPGDDIWFKAYLINAADRLLSSSSINLHVELISPDMKIIDSRIVRLNNGLGNGDFHLSEKLKSGRYRLRAYTNYMQNFGDQLFFNNDISVINLTDASKAFSDSTFYERNKPDIIFFPEGGSLIENVTSKVAFKAVDIHGYAQEVSGEIFSSAGEKVAEFKSIHQGMGSFSITPAPGLTYFALIKNRNGDSLKFEIPKSFSEGVVLDIYRNQDGKLSLIFKTNPATFPIVSANDLSITVSIRKIAIKTYSFRMKSLNSFLNIPTQDLPDGIIMLTLSGADNIPLCERLVYIQNNEEVKVKIETNKTEYNQRDSVSLRLSLSDSSGKANGAFLSLSAINNIFTDNSSKFPSNISSWFLLESDVRGPVEEPSYYFDHSNPDRLSDLDLLLLTQGWRDFEWKYNKMNYPPEYGFTISGRVRKKFANVSLKNSTVNIGIFQNGKPIICVVPIDSAGKFCLTGVDLTGDAEVIASATNERDKLKGWLFLDTLKYSPASVAPGIIQRMFTQGDQENIDANTGTGENQRINKYMNTYIQYAEIRNTLRKKYKLSDTITPGEVNIIAIRQDKPESARASSRRYLMGTPDRELVITPDLLVYNNAFQLINSRYLNPFTKSKFKLGHRMLNPIYMINGNRVPKSEVESLPLSWVDRIDVVDGIDSFAALRTIVEMVVVDSSGRPILSFGYADGAISIILKNDKEIVNNSVLHSGKIKFSGFSEPRIFYSPKHLTKSESAFKPDLRTTLLWEPDIKLENNQDILLNYYNADNPSRVRVIVEGITTGGIPVTGMTEYEVK